MSPSPTASDRAAEAVQPRDLEFMARALTLARRGLYTTDPNPRVGCVLVRAGRIVGEGWHARRGGPHAEIEALRIAGEAARGATAYVTLEPCCHHGRTGPCTEALVAAGVAEVIAASPDPDPRVAGGGLAALARAGVSIRSGVMESAARALNAGFFLRMESGRPLVRCKLAMSLDGRTAMHSGESRWITGTAARRDVQGLRARSSAVITGVDTVLLDDPALTVREAELGVDIPGGARQPLRVILDSRLRTPPGARILGHGGTLVITAATESDRSAALERAGAEVVVLPARDARVDLRALPAVLAAREINEVLLECGPTLAGAALADGLVDEIVLYVAPKLLGCEARGLFSIPGLARMRDAIALELIEVRAVGDDLRITARPRRPSPDDAGGA